MKWFKHLTGSIKDPMIVALIDNFGAEGYLVFFGLLDLMSEDFDVDNPGVCTFEIKYLLRCFHIKRKTFLKVIEFEMNYKKNNNKTNAKIYATYNGDKVTLKCDRLKDLCDEFTQKHMPKKSGLNRDSIGIDSDSLARAPKDLELEEEKECTPPTPPPPESVHDNPLKNWHTPKTQELRSRALSVLHALNKECGKRFKDNYPGLRVIMERLDEGRTCEECLNIILAKKADEHFQKHREFLCPETLFSLDHFDRYLSEYVEKEPDPPPPDNAVRIDQLAETRALLEREHGEETREFQTFIKENLSINDHSYRVFIEPLLVVERTPDKLVLFADPDSALWVRDHYLSRIQDCYEGITVEVISDLGVYAE